MQYLDLIFLYIYIDIFVKQKLKKDEKLSFYLMMMVLSLSKVVT